MKKHENAVPSLLGVVVLPALLGFAVSLILMIAGVVLVQRGIATESVIGILSRVSLFVGGMIASMIAARRASSGKLLCAMCSGVLLFVLLAGISLALVDAPVHVLHTIVSVLCILVASFLGGVLGMQKKRSKKYRHIRK